jgi:hypothetical protein
MSVSSSHLLNIVKCINQLVDGDDETYNEKISELRETWFDCDEHVRATIKKMKHSINVENIIENMINYSKCFICMEVYHISENKKSLCGHDMCSSCLYQIVVKFDNKCSACLKPVAILKKSYIEAQKRHSIVVQFNKSKEDEKLALECQRDEELKEDAKLALEYQQQYEEEQWDDHYVEDDHQEIIDLDDDYTLQEAIMMSMSQIKN